jgi:hypothetical protein
MKFNSLRHERGISGRNMLHVTGQSPGIWRGDFEDFPEKFKTFDQN